MLPKATLALVLSLLFSALVVPTLAFAGGKPGGTPTTGPITVELDPGHGGTETGAVNDVPEGRLLEKDVNLTIALATEAKLKSLYGTKYDVRLTRRTDVNMSRPDRYNKANADGAKVLVSIHHNGSSDAGVNYTTSYYTQRSDLKIAQFSQAKLVQYLGFNDGGIRHDGFTMTVRPKMPSTLTEAWFITHDPTAGGYLQEIAAGTSGGLVDREATALAEAINAYFGG